MIRHRIDIPNPWSIPGESFPYCVLAIAAYTIAELLVAARESRKPQIPERGLMEDKTPLTDAKI